MVCIKMAFLKGYYKQIVFINHIRCCSYCSIPATPTLWWQIFRGRMHTSVFYDYEMPDCQLKYFFKKRSANKMILLNESKLYTYNSIIQRWPQLAIHPKKIWSTVLQTDQWINTRGPHSTWKVKVLVAQSCVTLCDPMDSSCQAPLSMGFSKSKNSG